jgi:hypothetical protein
MNDIDGKSEIENESESESESDGESEGEEESQIETESVILTVSYSDGICDEPCVTLAYMRPALLRNSCILL